MSSGPITTRDEWGIVAEISRENEVFRTSLIVVLVATLSGCVGSLRCGTDGDSSYVDVINIREIPSAGRYYAELCSFAYQQEADTRDIATIEILENAL